MKNGYKTLQTAFEAAADRYSECIALKYKELEITY